MVLEPSDLNNHALTVSDAVQYWLENREAEVRPITFRGYKQVSLYIVGPVLIGSRAERRKFTLLRIAKPNAQFIEMLGPMEIRSLTTAHIRSWHKTLTAQVSGHVANFAKKLLRAALCLAAEDLGTPLPAMPTRLGRGRAKPRKQILTPTQVGHLLTGAMLDKHRGLYYAFPFLTGVRPSEQLGLFWEDVDFGQNVIRIRRTQLPDGTLWELTKTEASSRDIPISPLLNSMLLNWRSTCPGHGAGGTRVFPCSGRAGRNAKKTGGRPLLHTNFIYTYWRPALAALGLPMVTPHSARHAFISTLQAQGIEVAVVAKLAGHADLAVTLSARFSTGVRASGPRLSDSCCAPTTSLRAETDPDAHRL
jgi:integrase